MMSRFGDPKISSWIAESRGVNGAISSEFRVTRCNSVGPKQVGLMATTSGKIYGMYNGSANNLPRKMNALGKESRPVIITRIFARIIPADPSNSAEFKKAFIFKRHE